MKRGHAGQRTGFTCRPLSLGSRSSSQTFPRKRPRPPNELTRREQAVSDERRAGGKIPGMDSFPDVGSLSDGELKDLIRKLSDEEVAIASNRELLDAEVREIGEKEATISYRRRVLHGKIDILRGELVNRLRSRDEGEEEGGGDGSAGVRQPRGPAPRSGADGISLPTPDEDGAP
jgi:hypothetical protein